MEISSEQINQNNIRRQKLSALPKVFGLIAVAGTIILGWQVILHFRQALPGPDSDHLAITQTQPKPSRLIIDSLHINAPVEELNLNGDGSLQVPKEDFDAGWYTGSPTPGSLGPSVIVGHLDSVRGKAIFYDLKNLKPGDDFTVKRSDGSSAIFRVDNLQSYPQNNFPTDKVYGQINYAGIRLITCSGAYSKIVGHYSDNLVVYGTLVGLIP